MSSNTKNSILVVDDTVNIRLTIARVFKKEYTMYFAENGQEALELFFEKKPDVTLLDLRMPIMDGIEFLKKSNYKPDDGHQAIIVVSGHGDDEDIEECFDMGVSNFLTKPYNIYELKGSVISCINRINQMKKIESKMNDLKKEVTKLKAGSKG